MGCGCRRSKTTGTTQISAKLTAEQREKIREATERRTIRAIEMMKKNKVQSTNKLQTSTKISDKEILRRKLCQQCPYKIIRADGKQTIEMCGKANRAIFIIVKDLSFSCPVGRFLAGN